MNIVLFRDNGSTVSFDRLSRRPPVHKERLSQPSNFAS